MFRIKRTGFTVGVVAMLAVLLASCGSPDPTATPTPTTAATTGDQAPTATATEEELFAAEWEELIAAAQKEGELVSMNINASWLEWLDAAFGREFGINLVHAVGSFRDNRNRVIAEQAAGRFTVDLMTAGGSTGRVLSEADANTSILPFLVHPDVKDPSRWKDGRFRFLGGRENATFIYGSRVGGERFAFNTKFVEPGEITTHDDLLNPKFKGKIVVPSNPADPTERVSSLTVERYMKSAEGKEWIRRFWTEMDPVIIEDDDLRWNAVIRGTYWITPGDQEDIRELVGQGFTFFDGVEPQDFLAWRIGPTDTIQLFKNPPNPNALKLFVNWLLSDAGWDSRIQATRDYPDMGAHQATLEDIPLHLGRSVDHLPPSQRLPDGDLVIPQEVVGFIEAEEERREALREIVRGAGY